MTLVAPIALYAVVVKQDAASPCNIAGTLYEPFGHKEIRFRFYEPISIANEALSL